MPGFATLAEMLAAKAGRAAPEVEESLASKLATSADSALPESLSSAESSSLSNPSTSYVDPTLNPDSVKNFNALASGENMSTAAKAGMGGLAAYGLTDAVLNGGGKPPSTGLNPALSGPAPASDPATPADPATPDPEDVKEESRYKRVLAAMMPSRDHTTDFTGLSGTSVGSNDEMKAAMAKRDANQTGNDIAKAGLTAGTAISGTDYNKMGGALLDEQGKRADLPVKDLEKLTENQENDAKSTSSVAMRAMAQKMGFKFGDTISAADIKKQIPQMASIMNHQEAADALKQKYAQAQLDRLDNRKVKMSEAQAKAESELGNHLETFRGNRVAQQAAMDQYSAAKALDMVKNKDPNTLTTQDLSLLAGEMSKIATGGVPTEHGIQALMPHNSQTKFAEMKNYLLSKPTDAQAAEYIKRNMTYLNQMTESADQTLGKYRQNILDSYKNRVTPDAYKQAQLRYSLGQPANLTTNSASGGMSADDQQAVQWAKSNPSDPRAKKILQLHGM